MHVTDRIFIFLISSVLFLPSLAFSGPENFTYQGQIIKPNGQALEASSVDFRIELISPGAEECVLYREEHTLNMSNSNGIFSIEVGSGMQSGAQYQDTTDLATALSNSTGTVSPDLCVMGGSYAPNPNDGRRLRITFNDGSGPVTLAQDHNIVSVPYAANATSIGGLGAGDFIQVNSGPGFNLDQTNIEFVFNDSNWTELQALLDGTSTSFTSGAPTADVDNNNQKIINLADPNPATDSDAVNVGYARSYIGGQQVDTADLGALGAGQNGEVLTWDGTQWNSQVIDDVNKLPLGGGTMTGSINMGNQDITNANDISASNNISATNNLSIGQDASVGNDLTVIGGIGVTNGINSASHINLANESELQLAEATGNGTDYVSLKSPAALAAPVNLILPNNDGDPGQYLQTDGSGVLSWQDVNAGVTQVFGRTGNVVATAGDYDADLITFDNTYGGDVDTATEVQGAIEELSTEKVAKSGDSMTGNLVMDLNGGVTTELRFQDTGTKYIGFKAPNTVNAVSSFVWTLPDDDGGAGQVLQTSGGGVLSWTSVAAESRSVTAGQGLTGGGDLSSDRTFDIGAGNGITVNADDIEVTAYNGITVDNNGVSVNGGNGIIVDASGVHVDIAGTADETVVEGSDSILIRDNSDSGNLKEVTRTNFVLSEAEVDTFVSNNGFFTDGGNSATGDLTLGNNDNFGLNLETNNNVALRIDNTGNVGIGTSVPVEKLHLYGDTDSIHRMWVENVNSGTSARSSIVARGDVASASLTTYSSSNNQGLGYGTLTADNLIRLRANSSNAFLIDTTNSSPLVFGTDNSERLRIDTLGRVGIGTSLPSDALHVQVADPKDGLRITDNGSGNGIQLQGNYPSVNLNQYWDGSNTRIIGDGYSGFMSMDPGVGDINFGVGPTGNAGDTVSTSFVLRLLNTGNVRVFNDLLVNGNLGVGTNSPTSKLQIAGGVQIGNDLALCDGTKAGTLKYSGSSVSYCDGTSWEAFGTAAGGEVNDGANVGTGEGVFKSKNGLNLEFKSIGSANGKIAISSDADNITLTIDESAFDPTTIPVGTTPLTATTLQAAFVELEADKVSTSRSVISGGGLVGGGDLSSDRTLAVGAGDGITVNADDIAVVGGDAITVDGTGVNVDITNETAEASVAAGDEVLIYDASAGALRKMTRSNFVLSNAEVEAIIADDGYVIDGGNTPTGSLDIGTTNTENLNFLTNNSTAMTIDTSGNVGIGTTNPGAIIDIRNNNISGTHDDIFIFSARDGSSSPSFIMGKERVGGAYLQDEDTIGKLQANSFNGSSIVTTPTASRISASLNFKADGNHSSNNTPTKITFETDGGQERLVITDLGNIGIGTTAPAAPSHLYTDATIASRIERDNGGQVSLQFINQDGNPIHLGLNDFNDFAINDGSNITGGAKFILKRGTGRVGIGTTSPQSQLQVAGGVQIGDDLALCDGTKEGTLKYVGGSVSFCDGSTWTAFGTASGGEVNDGANVGTGEGIFKAKNGLNLEFKSIDSANGKIAVSSTADDVTLTIDESVFDPTVIPVGTTPLTATTLQAALVELEGTKVSTTRSIASGAGLAGGGDLTTDRTLAVGAGNGINVNPDDIEVVGGDAITVDGTGVNVDITNETAEATVAANDELLIFDTSANGLRKMTRDNFVRSASEINSLLSSSGYILDGGNSEGAAVTIGTNDANSLNFETNNATAMTILSDGKIGLGTSSPNSILEVVDDSHPRFNRARTNNGSSSGSALRLTRSFNGGVGGAGIGVHQDLYVETSTEGVEEPVAQIGAVATDATSGSVDSYFFLSTRNNGAAVEAMRLLNDGSVGIGTSTPSEKLDIAGGNLRIDYDQSVYLGTTGHGLGTSTSTFSAELFSDANMRIYAGTDNSGVTENIEFFTDVARGSTTGQRMVIEGDSGNVGIGTSTPQSRLEVNGRITQGGIATLDGYLNTNLVNNTGLSSQINFNPGLLVYEDPGSYYGMDLGYNADSARYRNRIFASDYGDIAFSSHVDNVEPTDQTSFTDLMVIRGDTGNVGIGTSAPARLLQVEGAARLTPTALPGTPAAGDVAIDSGDSNKLKYYDGSSWVEAGGSAGGGDILNGGNSLSAPVTVGTNDAQDLNLETNNTTAINIDSSQNINFEGNAYLYDFLYGANSGNYLRMGNTAGAGGITLFSANDYVELRGNNLADVRFTTNSLERMRVTSTGNVGIGTTNPDQLLTISSNNPVFRFDRSGANFDVELAAGSNGDFTISGGADGTGVALTEYFTIKGGSGAIGIGTDSPSVELDVHNGTINAALLCDENNSNCLDLSSGISGSSLWTDNAGDISYTSGNVGIGTTTPSSALDVVSSVGNYSGLALARFRTAGGSRFDFLTEDNSGGNFPARIYNSSGWGIGLGAANGVRFYTSTSKTERMRIDSSGNVGVGTTAPASRLHILNSTPSDNSSLNGGETMVIEDSDAQLNLVSSDGGAQGSGIHFTQVDLSNATDFENKWYMGRQTNGDGTGNGDFFIKYGSDTYGPNNDTVMSFRANGDHKVRIEADKDDVDEEDNPHLVLVQDGTVEKAGFYLEGSAAGQANALSISASDSSGNGILFRAGTSDNAYEGAPIRMKIDGSGNVGVGTVNPVSKLDVSGQVRSVNSSGSSEVNTTATVDWHNGNAQTMNVDCDTTTFSNMLDGGTYILAVSETGTSQCDFSQAGLTFFFSPANGPRESGARTVYTFQRIGSDVYVSWIKGFQ